MKCSITDKKITETQCKECLFYIEKRDADEYLYMVCDFENWINWNYKGKIQYDKPTNLI